MEMKWSFSRIRCLQTAQTNPSSGQEGQKKLALTHKRQTKAKIKCNRWYGETCHCFSVFVLLDEIIIIDARLREQCGLSANEIKREKVSFGFKIRIKLQLNVAIVIWHIGLFRSHEYSSFWIDICVVNWFSIGFCTGAVDGDRHMKIMGMKRERTDRFIRWGQQLHDG